MELGLRKSKQGKYELLENDCKPAKALPEKELEPVKAVPVKAVEKECEPAKAYGDTTRPAFQR